MNTAANPSRMANPKIPSVLSFGKIAGGNANNVIPDEVRIEGTFRTFDETWRADAHQKITQLATNIAQSMGGECEIEIRKGYPFLYNAPHTSEQARDLAVEYLGEDKVENLDLWLAAEDFAWYSQEIDASFYRLGTGNEGKGIVSGVHTSTFDIDESSLEIGAGLMAWLALNFNA